MFDRSTFKTSSMSSKYISPGRMSCFQILSRNISRSFHELAQIKCTITFKINTLKNETLVKTLRKKII